MSISVEKVDLQVQTKMESPNFHQAVIVRVGTEQCSTVQSIDREIDCGSGLDQHGSAQMQQLSLDVFLLSGVARGMKPIEGASV